MAELSLTAEERKIIDIFNPNKTEYQLPEILPVDFIINNKLCFSLYSKIGSKLDSKFESKEIDQISKKARYMEFSIAELQNVSKAFEENGIDFVFLFKAIETQCDTTDVDTIIRDAHIEKAGKVLEGLGYFVPLFPYEKYNFVKSKGSNEVVLISLQTEEEFKKYHYVVDEEKMRILRNKRKINRLYVPSVENDLIICLLRMIKKKQIPVGTILHITHLLENCRDLNYMRDGVKKLWYTPLLQSIYVTNSLYKSLFDNAIDSPFILIAEKAHEDMRILKFSIVKEPKKIKFPFTPKPFLAYWHTCELLINIRNYKFIEIAKNIFKPFRIIIERIKLVATARKRKMLICFSGIDGTGKTTNATELTMRFKDMSIPSQYVSNLWSPKISYPLMGVLFVLKGWRKKDYAKSKIMKKIWNYIVILDFIYIYMTKMWFPGLVGKTLFCDKYTYDLIIMLMYNGLYNERASRILLKSVPKPDLTFILDIPEDVSNLRKDDTKEGIDSRREEVDTMDYLKIRRDYFILIAKSFDIPIIDATKGWNELHEDFFNKIITRYKNKGVNKK